MRSRLEPAIRADRIRHSYARAREASAFFVARICQAGRSARERAVNNLSQAKSISWRELRRFNNKPDSL